MPSSSASQTGLDGKGSASQSAGASPAPQPSSTGSGDDGYTPPGVRPSGGGGNNNSGSPSNGDGSGSGKAPGKTAGMAAGIVVGLCLVGAAVFAYYRHRRRRGRWADNLYHNPYSRGGGPMSRGLAVFRKPSSQAHATSMRGPGGGAGGGIRRAVSGFVAAHVGTERRRFDMLRDEESDVWRNSLGSRTRDDVSGWDLADVELGEDDENRRLKRQRDDDDDEDGEMMSESGRGGMGIWKGLYGSSRMAGTRASFLGTALGPLVAGARDGDELEVVGNSQRPNSDQSGASYGTVSTGVVAVAKRVQRKPVPVALLDVNSTEDLKAHGTSEESAESGNTSGSAPMPPPTPLHGAFSPDASGQYEPLHRSKTWWDRFRDRAVFVASPSVNVPIRDPNPAPSLSAIAEHDPVTEGIAAMAAAAFATGPKTTKAAAKEEAAEDVPGEHGRRTSLESQPYSMRSRGTETSSMLEERMHGMAVFVRDPSSQRSRGDDSVTLSDGGMSSEDAAEGPFSDRRAIAAGVEQTPSGQVAWDGRVVAGGGGGAWLDDPLAPERTTSPEPLIAATPTPPKAVFAASSARRGGSDAGRLHRTPTTAPRGPRELASASSSSTALPQQQQQSIRTAGSTGVRHLVEQFERASSASASGSSAPSSPEVPRRGGRGVQHHFAPRPTLFVANPDNRSDF
jgi:hypothetical protein